MQTSALKNYEAGRLPLFADGQSGLIEKKDLYRSDTLLVRQVDAGAGQNWVITFDHHSIGEGFDRPGFGEEFLFANEISAIHVLGRGNDWYQYPDAFDAMTVVRMATADAARRITYGSSMGGYAAVRFADAVGADGVLALSPQWSLNPTRAHWDDRWLQDSKRVQWIDAIDGRSRCRARPVLLYDPHVALDLEHVSRIAAETPSILLPIPYSGHPATTFLGEVSLLRPALEAVLQDRFDPAMIKAEIRARRSTSSVYLGSLAERQPEARPRVALALARAAHAAKPKSLLGMLSLARILARTGNHAEATSMHSQIAVLTDRMPLYLIPFAEDLWLAGARSEAIAIGNEIVRELPHVAHLRTWLSAMMWKNGERGSAIRQQKVAVSLTPENRRYRRRLRSYRLKRYKSWFCLSG